VKLGGVSHVQSALAAGSRVASAVSDLVRAVLVSWQSLGFLNSMFAWRSLGTCAGMCACVGGGGGCLVSTHTCTHLQVPLVGPCAPLPSPLSPWACVPVCVLVPSDGVQSGVVGRFAYSTLLTKKVDSAVSGGGVVRSKLSKRTPVFVWGIEVRRWLLPVPPALLLPPPIGTPLGSALPPFRLVPCAVFPRSPTSPLQSGSRCGMIRILLCWPLCFATLPAAARFSFGKGV
jgi:hypothetical protein